MSRTVTDKGWNSSPKQGEKEVGKSTVDSIVRRRTFEPLQKPTVGKYFFIFKEPGDQIEGKIGAPIPNIRRNCSYPIELDTGETVEIFGNRLLHRILQNNELINSRVRIVYIGREDTNYGSHKRKIYRVYKVNNFLTSSKVEEQK